MNSMCPYLYHRINKRFFGLSLIFWTLFIGLNGQISQAGWPLLWEKGAHTRSMPKVKEFFQPFDTVKWSATLDRKMVQSCFAYPIEVDISPLSEGESQIIGDRKVWTYTLSSKGALSLNLIFDRYQLPKGGRLFLYNTQTNGLAGAFTDANNHPDKILATAPVQGDQITIEYSQPIDCPEEPELHLSTINHDFKGVLKTGPAFGRAGQCIPSSLCYPEFEEESRSVCLMIVNGRYFATGALITDAEHSGTPYVLTACHTFKLAHQNLTYQETARRTVFFFKYEAPRCEDKNICGSMEFAMAGSDLCAYSDSLDFTLLRLDQLPPPDYNPYLLGWTIAPPSGAPYSAIHHPNGDTKRYSRTDKEIKMGSVEIHGFPLLANHFWEIQGWDVGVTEGGSSGSPLLDKNHRVVGALTGGSSYCYAPMASDYYFMLSKSWARYPHPTSQLSYWLDPLQKGIQTVDGFDPYKESVQRIRIASTHTIMESAKVAAPATGFIAGHNSLGIYRYANRIYLPDPGYLYGLHGVSFTGKYNESEPITISVRKGGEQPGEVLSTLKWLPSYLSTDPNGIIQSETQNRWNKDSYFRLDTVVSVERDFYICVDIPPNSADTFALYHTGVRSGYTVNKGYFFDGSLYQPFTKHPNTPFAAALWLEPVWKKNPHVDDPINRDSTSIRVMFLTLPQSLLVKLPVDATEGSISVYNTAGSLVFRQRVDDKEAFIEMGQLGKGLYLAVVEAGGRKNNVKFTLL